MRNVLVDLDKFLRDNYLKVCNCNLVKISFLICNIKVTVERYFRLHQLLIGPIQIQSNI